MTSEYRLITIPPSHYCEKARWALDRVKVAYREEGHPPLLHWRAVKAAGGVRTVPVLVTGDEVLTDSTDILQFLDATYTEAWRPYPMDSGLRVQCEELEDVFDTRLGPHTRRVAYFHLLPNRKLLTEAVSPGVGGVELATFKVVLPVVRWLMRRGMNITPVSAQRSLDRVRTVFESVAEKIADGRRFLVGDRFTAADLTFAALAAPVLLPRNYGSALPALDAVPGEFLALIEEFRSLPAGEFALRMYRDLR
jgi:glutathione S-transferase